jgi:hypothetical protein
MMCLLASYEKNMIKSNIYFATFKSIKKSVGSDPEPDPLVRGTDPGIRIRIHTEMSQIPNTATEI